MSAYTFKSQINADISAVFINLAEFADTYNINGRQMPAVLDDNELIERDKAKLMQTPLVGTYRARRLVYVAKADFGARPAQGAALNLNGKEYRVQHVTEEMGVLAIEIEAVRS